MGIFPDITLGSPISGFSNLSQTDLDNIAREGIEVLDWHPTFTKDVKAAQPYVSQVDSSLNTKAKTGKQPFPTRETHPITVHLVRTIALGSDLKTMGKWATDALAALQNGLANETVSIDSSDALTKSQKVQMKKALNDTHISFNTYHKALTDPNYFGRDHIIRVWNKNFWAIGKRHDALIYSDVYRMTLQIASYHKIYNACVIGTSSILGLDPSKDTSEQLRKYIPLIKKDQHKQDPKSVLFASAMQDCLASIVSSMRDQAKTYNDMHLKKEHIDEPTSHTMSAITYGVIVHPSSPTAIFSRDNPITDATSAYYVDYSKPASRPVTGQAEPNITPVQTSSFSIPPLYSPVTFANPVLPINNFPGQFGNSGSISGDIQSLIVILEGLKLIFTILNDGGFQIIQALECYLDSLINQFVGQLLMEMISVMTMVQGQLMQPLVSVLNQINMAVTPFVSNPQTWDSAANMMVSSLESLTGRFYSRLTDWYRKEISQVNNAITKALSLGTNNQYGNLLNLIQEIINYLGELQFYSVQLQGNLDESVNQLELPVFYQGDTSHFQPDALGNISSQTPNGQFIPKSDSFKNAIKSAQKNIGDYYKQVSELPKAPQLEVKYPHIKRSTEAKILSGVQGRFKQKGKAHEIASSILDSMQEKD